MLRNGSTFEDYIRSTLAALARLGDKIMEGSDT